MSFGFGNSEKRTDTTRDTTTDPWAPTVPLLKDLLGKLQGADTSVSPAMTGAFDKLKANASAGNPYAGSTAALAKDLYATPSQLALSSGAYGMLQDRLSGIAGQDNDPMKTPGIAGMLNTLNGDITKNISGQFAAAGRSGSPAHAQALARGLAQGEGGLLLDQYNKNVGAQTGAAQVLQSAGESTAATNAGLQAKNAALRMLGIDAGNTALQQQDYSPLRMLEIGQQEQGLPFQNLGLLAKLLIPLAGIGGQSKTQGTDKTETDGWKFSLPLIG